jgi:hypothetical protein
MLVQALEPKVFEFGGYSFMNCFPIDHPLLPQEVANDASTKTSPKLFMALEYFTGVKG